MNKEAKEKERTEKLKALRRELEEKLEEQLLSEYGDGPSGGQASNERPVPVGTVPDLLSETELDRGRAKQVIEALLFASAKPLTLAEIRKVLRWMKPAEIQGLIHELKEDYVRSGRSFEIIEIANGFEIATKKEFAAWIFKIELQKKAKQVTQSALETLAILAYKQPVTRAEIEDLRGVDVSGVMNTLAERGLIKIVGRKEVPGRPFLYGTTDKFLEHFGLKSLAGLPNIDEIKNLVENSVKKEGLLGTQRIVDVPQEAEASTSEEGRGEPMCSPEEENEGQTHGSATTIQIG